MFVIYSGHQEIPTVDKKKKKNPRVNAFEVQNLFYQATSCSQNELISLVKKAISGFLIVSPAN